MKDIAEKISLVAVWVRLKWIWLAFLGILLIPGSCGPKDNDPKPGPPVQQQLGKAHLWITSGDQSRLLAQQNDISILKASANPTIIIDTTVTYQQIEGFGAALTGSSAYLINKKMNSSQRSALLSDLFNASAGIGISYLRMTIGSSDFSLSDYTYDDVPSGQTDDQLASFSIAKDKEDVVPVLKQIVTINPNTQILGSPWSAPAWMKTNGSLKGGKLRTDAYDAYARYFVKYINAFKAEGITINAITPQNEPLYATASYPCMDMQPADQLDFIKNNLGPTFQAEGIDAKILIYDHNWDNTNYAISILDDPTAAQYVAGSAFHAYAGDVSAMTTVHSAHPEKGLYFTEISGGAWAPNFSDNLQWMATNIFIGTAKNWSKTALLWNLALDENSGPKNNGCQDCRGVVTVNSISGSVTKNVEYYVLAHFSKFIKPAAFRVSSTTNQSLSGISHVAFVNPDGSKVLVVLNSASTSQTFSAQLGERLFNCNLAASSIATIVW